MATDRAAASATAETRRALVAERYPRTIAEVDALCAIADPESEPFRSRYAAAAALESLEDAIERSLPDDALDATDEDVRALVDVRAFVARRRGAIALDTEDWSAGETFLERARALLSRPAASPAARRVPLLQTNNALGVLWCNRGDPERALPFLHAARDAHDASPAPDDVPGSGSGSAPEEETAHTETLFFLAQAYARLGREDDSASACAACLRRQVERAGGAPAPDPTEWAQNAAQLSGFYVSRAAWSTARHCVAAAERVFRDAHPTWAPKHGPHANPADERAAANAPDPDPDSADVGANAQLAWGKLHLRRLTTARDLAVAARGGVETEAAAAARASATNGDDARLLVSFPSLGLDDGGARAASSEARAVGLASEGPSEGWIPRDVVGARKVFNEAAPRYRAALSRYTIDGFVTEHCDALMDVSALLKSLAFFERGNRRRHNSLHRRRVRTLEPAASAINPERFPGLHKTLWFEIGEAHRAVLEFKMEVGRPAIRISAPAREASRAYRKFLDAFDPTRVPEDEARAYLTARFVRARTVSKTAGAGSEADALTEALREYEAVAEYCERNDVAWFADEAKLCREMAELLPTKIANERLREADDRRAVDPIGAGG